MSFSKRNIPWNKGIPRSEETKAKISQSTKGHIYYGRATSYIGKGNPFYGKHHSEEVRQVLSEARKGKPSARNGYHLTDEEKKVISERTKESMHSLRVKEHLQQAWTPQRRKQVSEFHKKDSKRPERIRASIANLPEVRYGRENPAWRGGGYKPCAYCGEPMWVMPWQEGIKKYCSRECQNKTYAIKNIKDSNPNWRGGISKEPYPFNFTQELKEAIRSRDNHTCQLCGVPEMECLKKLPIHHIDYNKENLATDNLISLCKRCHSRVNGNRDYWQDYFLALLRWRLP